jgi:Fe-S cluster biosynthesis and repair protein YggX
MYSKGSKTLFKEIWNEIKQECYRWQMQQQDMNINRDTTTGLMSNVGRQKRNRIKLKEHLYIGTPTHAERFHSQAKTELHRNIYCLLDDQQVV